MAYGCKAEEGDVVAFLANIVGPYYRVKAGERAIVESCFYDAEGESYWLGYEPAPGHRMLLVNMRPHQFEVVDHL